MVVLYVSSVCVCVTGSNHIYLNIYSPLKLECTATSMNSNEAAAYPMATRSRSFSSCIKKDDRKRCWKWHKLSMATGTGKYISANYVFISSCLPFWAIFKIQERLESKRCKMQQLEPVRAHVATAVAHSETTCSDNVDFVKKWHKFMHLFARQRLFEKLNV